MWLWLSPTTRDRSTTVSLEKPHLDLWSLSRRRLDGRYTTGSLFLDTDRPLESKRQRDSCSLGRFETGRIVTDNTTPPSLEARRRDGLDVHMTQASRGSNSPPCNAIPVDGREAARSLGETLTEILFRG